MAESSRSSTVLSVPTKIPSDKLLNCDPKEPLQFLNVIKNFSSELNEKNELLKAELLFQESQAPYEQQLIEGFSSDLHRFDQQCKTEQKSLLKSITKFRCELSEQHESLETLSRQLLIRQRAVSVVQCIKHMQHIHTQLVQTSSANDWTTVTRHYAALVKLRNALINSKCTLIITYVKHCCQVWASALQTRLNECLIEQLKLMPWPFQADKASWPLNECEAAQQMVCIMKCWCSVWSNQSIPDTDHNQSIIAPSIIDCLVEPFEKRFHYHFYGDRKTNSLDKPEWFYTQILQWASSHCLYLDERVQPNLQLQCSDNKQVLVSALVLDRLLKLVHAKLENVLEELSSDAVLFTHWLDETVVFELELANSVGCSSVGCLDVFCTSEQALSVWLNVEREANTERVDQLLGANGTWLDRYAQAGTHTDLHKVPECADEFIILLQLITERYRLVQNVVHREQFARVQLELIDDLRVRFLTIFHSLSTPWASPYMQLMNATAYIQNVLTEWNDQPFFIQLQHFQTNAKANSTRRVCGLFDAMSELYQVLWLLMCEALVQSVVNGDCAHALQAYTQIQWHQKRPSSADSELNITGAFCALLLRVRARLVQMRDGLSQASYHSAVKMVADELCLMMQNDVIEQTSFSESGAKQMLHDVTNALIPLFEAYQCCRKEDLSSAVCSLVECLCVLSLPMATVILLRESLSVAESSLLIGQLADDFNITHLSPAKVLNLLKQRTDVP